MRNRVRAFSGTLLFLLLIFFAADAPTSHRIPALAPSAAPIAARARPDEFATRLNEALRQEDHGRALELVVDDQDGADRLFLGYLETTLDPAPSNEGEAGPIEKARCLADVFSRIYNLDLERGVVSFWDKADTARRRELLPILRDHFAAYQEARWMSRQMPEPIDKNKHLLDRCLSLAERYRKIPFAKGELEARLWAGTLGSIEGWKTWQMAKSVGDDVVEAWAAYYFGGWSGEGQSEFAAAHAVEAAERLHLPVLLQFALARQAWRALAHDDYEGHIRYLQEGLRVVQAIPVRQSMAAKSGHQFYPGEAWFLKTLWRSYQLKGVAAGGELFERGRLISRRYGGDVGELAYLIAAMPEFVRPGITETVASEAEALARRLGHPGWLAAFLMTKAGGLKGTRESQEALAALEEAAGIYKALGARGQYANCLNQRASFRVQANDLKGAAADFERAVEIYDELGLGEAALGLRTGAGVSLQAQPTLALKFLDDALARAKAMNEPGFIRGAYSGRGKVLAAISPTQSLEDFKQELCYCERHRENIGYPGEVPVAMRLVSRALRRMGEYREAVEMEQRRAEYSRTEGLSEAEADAYFELSTIYSRDLGEPAAAAEFVERYVRLLTRPGRRLTVNNCDRIASAYLSIGQPGRALEFWSKALDLAAAMPAGEYYLRMLHFNRARTYLDLGDYDAALSEMELEGGLIEKTFEAYYETFSRTVIDIEDYQATFTEIASSDGQSQRQFQSYDDPIDIQKAEWHNRVAMAYALSGDAARSAEASRRAIALESGSPAGSVLADDDSAFTPGDALVLAGATDEAILFFQRSVKRARDVGSLPKQRESLLKLGVTYERAGRLGDARRSLLEAVRIDREPPGPQVGRLAESLLALGSLEFRAGDLPRAEKLLTEARKMANPYDLNQIWRIERALAAVSVARGKHDQAKGHFELALTALEGGRERLRPEEFALRFASDRLGLYDEYASYLAGRSIETGAQGDAEKALLVVERRRAQALWDLMSLGWAGLRPEAVPEQLRRARAAEARLAAKQAILREQFGLPPDERQPAQIAELEADLKQVREEHAHLLTALAQGVFRFASPSPLAPDLIAEVRKGLDPGCALVEYLVTDETIYAFVLSPAGFKLTRLAIGRGALRQEVQSLLRPFYRLSRERSDLARLRFDSRTAHEIYQQIVAPLEPGLEHASRILIVPDDVLFYLPLELLVDTLPGAKRPGSALYAEFESGGFLIRRLTLSYLISATQVIGRAKGSDLGTASPSLLAMADPTAGPRGEASDREDPVRRGLQSATSRGAFSALPGSMVEVAQIRRHFPAGRATVLSGPKATETSYKALSSRSGIIHLATHAVAADDQPFYSTLVLAPDDQAREDGYLQAYEIVRIPLRAELVVLSGCETAKGPLGRGEGLVGLVSAFLQAGARSVLATEWSLDESSAQLMPSFYEALMQGTGTAEALRRAKLDFLTKHLLMAGTEVSLAHPFFWAPFILIGPAD